MELLKKLISNISYVISFGTHSLLTNISWNRLTKLEKRFHENFVQNVTFTDTVIAQCVEIAEIPHFFCKYFVKAMVLLKKLLNSWFDENFFQWERIYRFPHCAVVWKLQKFTLTIVWQKFRENNCFTKEITN